MRRPHNSGTIAEQHARVFLEHQGLRLKTCNYHCRRGEIDLIMQDGDCLVFVEVRKRSNPRFGSALDSIDAAKRRRLIATAQHYLQHGVTEQATRFDVIAIDGENQIQWIRDAFQANTF